MNDATPDAGASEATAQPSIHDRISAFLGADETTQQHKAEDTLESTEEVETETQAQPETTEDEETEAPDVDADEEPEVKPKNLRELSEKLGMTYEDLLDSIQAETKVDGEEGAVTLSKLLKSYQLEGSLNRKSMELSEAKKALEQEAQAKKQHFESGLTQLRTMLDANMRMFKGELANVDWKSLEESDPVEFLRLRTKFEDRNRELVQHHQFLQQEMEKQNQEMVKAHQAKLDEEFKQLVNSVPEWKDKAAAKKGQDELTEFLKASGLGDEDIAGVRNHKHVLLLRDAMKYRALQAKKKDVVRQLKEAPKLSRPGANKGPSDSENAKYVKLRAELKRTGKVPRGLLERFV